MILSEEIHQYIEANKEADLHKLLLKKSPFLNFSMVQIVQQIKGRRVAAKKFPFLQHRDVIFPPNLNLEQSSSQVTAQFKAQSLSGKSYLDLTAGFGIDAWFLSENFEEITLVERDTSLLETVEHNWSVLGRKAHFINGEIAHFLAANTQNFDLIYLDPARRDSEKYKKFLLEDLSPNLLKVLPDLKKISSHILVKLSPLIDISYLLNTISGIRKITIIAVRNEVKELVLTVDSKSLENADCTVECVNLEAQEPPFYFKKEAEKNSTVRFSEPLNYLYIPNNAILKAGAFNFVAEYFNVYKLHPNTHLYTSALPVTGFPGRVLKIETVSSSALKKGERYNIISKNHPLPPDQIKGKYKIKDGGEKYLIFTQSINGKIILKSL